jgi:hypothetical protein
LNDTATLAAIARIVPRSDAVTAMSVSIELNAGVVDVSETRALPPATRASRSLTCHGFALASCRCGWRAGRRRFRRRWRCEAGQLEASVRASAQLDLGTLERDLAHFGGARMQVEPLEAETHRRHRQQRRSVLRLHGERRHAEATRHQ